MSASARDSGAFFHQWETLVVLDSVRGHITDNMKQAIKSVNAVIPAGMTKFLQPLDISVNCSFKVFLQWLWEQWMTEGDHLLTKTGHMKWAIVRELLGS